MKKSIWSRNITMLAAALTLFLPLTDASAFALHQESQSDAESAQKKFEAGMNRIYADINQLRDDSAMKVIADAATNRYFPYPYEYGESESYGESWGGLHEDMKIAQPEQVSVSVSAIAGIAGDGENILKGYKGDDWYSNFQAPELGGKWKAVDYEYSSDDSTVPSRTITTYGGDNQDSSDAWEVKVDDDGILKSVSRTKNGKTNFVDFAGTNVFVAVDKAATEKAFEMRF